MRAYNQGITIDGLNIGWVMDRAICHNTLSYTNQNCQFINNKVYYWGQEGIRWTHDTSTSAMIANNEVYEGQTEPVFQYTMYNHLTGFTDAGSGIRACRIRNGVIRGNILHDIGGGLYNRSSGIDMEQGSEDTIIENNYVYNMATGNTSPYCGTALMIQSTGESHDGTIFQNNRIHNVDVGFALDFTSTTGLPAGDVVKLVNNTFSNCTIYGLEKQDGSIDGTFYCINNIFSTIAPAADSYDLAIRVANGAGMQVPQNCAYYCPNDPNPGSIINWKGTLYSSSTLTSLDAGSVYGNPNLSLTSSPPTLKILSPSGSAYDAGTSTYAPSDDFEGTPRPQGAAFDIGAHELAGAPSIAARWIFYNNCAWDGDDPSANASDDDAIATDKSPLQIGHKATFANYTSYSRGINGIMVDIANLPATPTAGDFEFSVGNDNDPEAWVAAPAPVSISVRPGAGAGGSHRVTIIWADNDIEKEWLEIKTLATANTGLTQDDVFYFGNAVGDCANSSDNTYVDAADRLICRANLNPGFPNPEPITSDCDFNRDKAVDASDRLIARANTTWFLNALNLISLTAAYRRVHRHYRSHRPRRGRSRPRPR
jgi:hypothetical protein